MSEADPSTATADLGPTVLGVIGGSGLYDLPGLEDASEHEVSSPWGEPSGPLTVGRIGRVPVVFLSRHGRGHAVPPDAIDYRANIDALKRAGVTDLVSLSAVGSYREALPPGHFALPDQYVDRTSGRARSFFGTGCVAHVAFGRPVGPRLQDRIAAAAEAEGIALTRGGTLVTMDGPQFSTRAESRFYRARGFDLVGMTALPEAKLAREAELTYATVAMVTDYDAWRDAEPDVDVAGVMAVMSANADKARRLVARLARLLPPRREPCPAGSHRALDGAIVTAPDARDPLLLAKLDAVAGRVLGSVRA